MNGRYCPFKKNLFLEKHDKFQHVFLYRKIKLLWECSSITSAGFPLFWTAPLCVTIVSACLTPYQNSKIQAIILAPAGGFLYNYHHHKENVPPIYKKCLSPRDKQFVCPPPTCVWEMFVPGGQTICLSPGDKQKCERETDRLTDRHSALYIQIFQMIKICFSIIIRNIFWGVGAVLMIQEEIH